MRRIDISNDTILCRILEDATDKVRYGERPAYYSISMGEYHDGIMIRIEISNSDVFEARNFPFAYTMINDRLIVFNHTGNYKIKDAWSKAPLTVKTARMDDQPYITDILFYYILDNAYAKFSREAGWIWSDGKPDE
ncbi:MAG: hypothetical protein K2K23_08045 [Muribaculaceae bacterium]|nr:hypothetical protein [Muribaculaceae bacterium]